MSRRYHFNGDIPRNGEIFVFGSNLQGRHGAGSALAAKNLFGAIYGNGEGMQGQAYALPTKMQVPGSRELIARELPDIEKSVSTFVRLTHDRRDLRFLVANVGCHLAGFTPEQIAPMFSDAFNCSFPHHWEAVLENGLWVPRNQGSSW